MALRFVGRRKRRRNAFGPQRRSTRINQPRRQPHLRRNRRTNEAILETTAGQFITLRVVAQNSLQSLRDYAPLSWPRLRASLLAATTRLSLGRDYAPLSWPRLRASLLAATTRLSLGRDYAPLSWPRLRASLLA